MANLPIRFMLLCVDDRRRNSGFKHSCTWDISLGGVSILTPIVVLDDLHFVEIPIPTICNQIIMQIYFYEKRKPVTALGMKLHRQVVLVNGHEAYHIGINFLQMSRPDGLNLKVFLNDVGEKRNGQGSYCVHI